MTNEEYRAEMMNFLEKTKTMNDQKVKKALGDRIDEIDKEEAKIIVEMFKKEMADFYENLRVCYADFYNIIIKIEEDEIDTFEDLNFKGTWIN